MKKSIKIAFAILLIISSTLIASALGVNVGETFADMGSRVFTRLESETILGMEIRVPVFVSMLMIMTPFVYAIIGSFKTILTETKA